VLLGCQWDGLAIETREMVIFVFDVAQEGDGDWKRCQVNGEVRLRAWWGELPNMTHQHLTKFWKQQHVPKYCVYDM
jgi:hypothetical protein